MSSPTPVRDGFRTIWRQPSIFFAELSWRWSWGGAALILTALALFEYSQTLIVTKTDLLLLRLRHPLAVSRALADIFHGGGPRVVRAAIVLIPALAILWTLLGAVGRFGTLRAIVLRFVPELESKKGSIRALIGLHALRVALALAGLVSLLGAALVASFVSTPKTPHAGLAFLIFVPLVVLVSMVWSSVNWFLSVAAVFVVRDVVRDAEDTFGAIAATVDFCRRNTGKISSIGFWFGLMHFVIFIIGMTVVMYPLAIVTLVPASVTLALMASVILAYLALADWLYVARLAGYVALLEWSRSPAALAEAAASNLPAPPPIRFARPLSPAWGILGLNAPMVDVSMPSAAIPSISVPNIPNLDVAPFAAVGPSLGSSLVSSFDDEPLFFLRPRPLADEDCDEPLILGFSPGEPLPGR